MKNLTISLEEPVFRRIRMAAAERGLSMSRFVSELIRKETEFRVGDEALVAHRRRWQEVWGAVDAVDGGEFSAGKRLSREEIYERGGIH